MNSPPLRPHWTEPLRKCWPSLSEPERQRILYLLQVIRRRLTDTNPAIAFDEWLPRVTPTFTWHWPHLAFIRRKLEDLRERLIDRLAIFVPPRHGKSEQVTVRWPAWTLEWDPGHRFIVGCHTADLAKKFSRRTRMICRQRGIEMSHERYAVDDWETAAGGGLRAVGVGNAVAGYGALDLIIDDPVKSRKESNSPAYRQMVWDWYTDDLVTRLEPNGGIVLQMTRWHEDDLAGRIIRSEEGKDWTIIALPAIAEANDPLGEEHHLSFTVAKMMDVDLLKTVRDAVDEAITTGKDIRWFERNLIPKLQAAGWWGKQAVVYPLTGQTVSAQLGSPARLRTIFRTNLQNAYAVGRWKTMQEQASVAPYAMYDAIDDHRTRPEHARLDELVLPLDDAFWKSHAPPNGWNCRCSLIQLDEHQLKSLLGKDGPDKAPRVKTRRWTNPRTGQVLAVPRDLDPGWDHNPGEATTVELDALLKEKIEALPADMRTAAKKAAARALAAEEAAKAKAAEERAAAKLKARMEAKAAEEAAQAAAQAELDAIAAGKLGTAHTQALKKVTQTTSAVKPTELLSEVQEAAATIKAAKALSANLSKYKSAVLTGKTPTPALVKAFDSLDEAGQAKVLADIEKKKAKQAAQAAAAKAAVGDVTPPRDLDLRRMTQIGPQRGSNPGGLYRDLDTGEQWYVKQPPSVEHARIAQRPGPVLQPRRWHRRRGQDRRARLRPWTVRSNRSHGAATGPSGQRRRMSRTRFPA